MPHTHLWLLLLLLVERREEETGCGCAPSRPVRMYLLGALQYRHARGAALACSCRAPTEVQWRGALGGENRAWTEPPGWLARSLAVESSWCCRRKVKQPECWRVGGGGGGNLLGGQQTGSSQRQRPFPVGTGSRGAVL